MNKKVNKNKLLSISLTVFKVLFFGLLLPAIIYYLIDGFFVGDVLWHNEAFHSSIEAIGSSLAIFLVIIILLYPKKRRGSYDYIISGVILGIALFDLFHSTVGVGNNFVYLHSMAIFVGGILSLFLFLPSKIANLFKGWWIFSVVIVVVFISIFSFIKPELTPMVVEEGLFNHRAKTLNYLGGIFLVVASFRLIGIYYKEWENKKYLLLATMCLLFGFSGILFESSEVWNMEWWYWHFLRFSAYIAVFFYIIIVFKDLSKNLLSNMDKLDSAQKDLRKNLKKTEKKEKELEGQNDELQKLNELMTGRELRMIELKRKIEELKKEDKK